MKKEEFMVRMSKLYDNYTKVVEMIGEQAILDCGWFVAHRDIEAGARFYDAWGKFVKAVREIDLDNEEFSDLVHFIADNKYKINEFIADCIN